MKASDLKNKAASLPDNGPPGDITPRALVSLLLSRGRPPCAVVDFPRFDEAGKPIGKVAVRLLTVTEEDLALANARKYVSEKLRTNEADLPWRPEELEHNARIMEILAIACRDAENMEEPFFAGGVFEARKFFNSDEMGALARVYAKLKTETHPALKSLSEQEMEEWISTLAEGWDAFPFALLSREQVEILCEHCVRSLVETRALLTSATATNSSSSD